MVIVRDLVHTLLEINTQTSAEYINTKRNLLADALSRQQVDRFRSQAPEADTEPVLIPDDL